MGTDAVGSLAPGEVAQGLDVLAEELAGLTWESAAVVGSVFEDCTFTSCNLSMARLPDTRFVDCTFAGCKMLAVDWTVTGAGSMLAQPLRFDRCRLDGSTFVGLDLTGVVFTDCALTDVDFSEAVLRRASFCGSELSGARFTASDLRDADLRGVRGLTLDPRENRLKGARLDLDATPALLAPFGVVVT